MYRAFNMSLSTLLSCLLVCLWISQPAASHPPTKPFQFGAYDPYGTFSGDPAITIEHIYIPWEQADLTSLQTAAEYAQRHNRSLLITVEPWSWGGIKIEPQQLYEAIVSGVYDERISALCTVASSLESPVTIRWGHEMDLRNGRFPWSDWSPSGYVSAYRHFVDRCRREASNLKFMWSPRGEKFFEAFYPGNNYVDSIGLTIFAYQDYEIGTFGRELTLKDRLDQPYKVLANYPQDLYITEFGCHGDKEYVKRCRDEVNSAPSVFPKLAGVIYFNEVDTFPWPHPYGHPDWRVFSALVASSGGHAR